VLSVVCFHFKMGPFGGGFVGVDIFFVISGYLIAGIIKQDLARGTFTFTGFYERRIRRILPVLGVVLLATAVAGAAVLLPTDLRRLGDSTIATALFGSNVYFWRHTGYFDSGFDYILCSTRGRWAWRSSTTCSFPCCSSCWRVSGAMI